MRLEPCSAPAENVVEGVGTLGGPRSLSSDQLYIERGCDPTGDLILQSDQIGCVVVEPLRPQMRVGRGINQLGVDADLIARSPDAPFEHIAHTEFAPDLLCVDPLTLISEGSV